jgi:Rps23 Pro-64 3,4-dihydroxylase Tpa1-like proline 4-hydroxylase
MISKDYLIEMIANKISASSSEIKCQWNHPEGTNTKHFIIDNLLPDSICHSIYSAFPRDGGGFFNRDSFREKKKTSADLGSYDPILAEITYSLQDPKIVELISEIINFPQLEPDPKLYAGGLSMMFQDDFLNPHLDNSHDGERSRFRRLNLLYYVTPDWKIENGGNLELWDDSRLIPKTIFAKTNRLAVMETNKNSWHSVSPVKVPQPRCCVSNYYFSKISPDSTDYFHVTSFTGRPGEVFRRVIGVLDNSLRNSVSKIVKTGRGKNLVNKDKG